MLKPAGSFNNIDCIPQEKVTMISAGCGITPVMSMVKYWLNSGEKIDIDFVHMARDKANTIYFDELELLAKQYDNFHLKLLLKNSADTQYPQGRLDQKWLSELSPDITQRTVYLCGPVGFMQDISHYLQQLNFDSANFLKRALRQILLLTPKQRLIPKWPQQCLYRFQALVQMLKQTKVQCL